MKTVCHLHLSSFWDLSGGSCSFFCDFGEMTIHKQTLDISVGKLFSVLMNGIGSFSECHSRDTIVLRNNNISLAAQIYQRDIHGICAGAYCA